MQYIIETNFEDQLPNIEAALKIIDPDAAITQSQQGLRINVILDKNNFSITVHSPDIPVDGSWYFQDRNILDSRYQNQDKEQRCKELVRLGVIKLLGQYFQKKPLWGILSGVRPTKIFHTLWEKGFAIDEIRHILLTIYALTPEKANLVLKVGELQTRFFKPLNYIGIYTGIPFCPTRCRYCSFAAVPLETHSHLVRNFIKGLKIEIDAMSRLCRELDLKVETIYLGGGTPTSLGEDDFTQVVHWLKEGFYSKETAEFTVEAGRPETISVPKLMAMKDAGVTRISINPQTMCQATLDLIGRSHTVEQIYDAVAMVRNQTPFILNMDLIMGLPKEGTELFLHSLDKVLALKPDNITIHTLAPKRAAAWRSHFSDLDLTGTDELIQLNQKLPALLGEDNYLPYYLYRQRMILADLENIGFSKPGMESIYNIQMMEERQTIIGIGGGAVTKWVTRAGAQTGHIVSRHQNPKCPATYFQRIAEEIVKKDQQSRLLLS